MTQSVVSPSEGNEVRREERLGVGASRSTDDVGEPFRGTPPSLDSHEAEFT